MNRVHWCAVLGLSALWLGACSTPPRTYDLVIANGRVMDPESGFDRVAHVGIVGNRIEAISDSPLRGNRSIDAGGLVVAPGLIELHTHGEDALNYGYPRDGRRHDDARHRARDGRRRQVVRRPGRQDARQLRHLGRAPRRARAGGWRQVRGLSFLGARAYQRGDARTDRSSRRARPPRARARRARRRLDAVLHAGGH